MSRSLVLVVVALVSLTFGQSMAAQDRNHAFVILRGRAVCLDAFDKPVDSPFACSEANPRFGLASKDGKLYRFSQTDSMITVFTDSRVRERELQITARLRESNQLETIKVQSIKDGKLYDIYYFCDICNIRAYTPGLCPCCRNELEFRETAQ